MSNEPNEITVKMKELNMAASSSFIPFTARAIDPRGPFTANPIPKTLIIDVFTMHCIPNPTVHVQDTQYHILIHLCTSASIDRT